MLAHDIRYAFRSIGRSKGFATVAILCLGLGIGLNTTIFSIVDGVLLKPYPYHKPERIVVVGARNQRAGNRSGLSYLDMRDFNAANSTLTSIAGSQARSLTIVDGSGEPERFLGAAISWDLFSLLGTSPILGRGFAAKDDEPGATDVVLLGYDLWVRRYQGDPRVIGRTILVNAKPYVVVGVMPPGFRFPENQRLWVPLTAFAGKDPREARGLFAFARLKPGVSIEQAHQDLDKVAARLASEYPSSNEGWASRIETLRDAFLPDEVTLVITLMMAGVTLVLFIACSNVANLLLARATIRRRELSVRAALGAGRARIVRQLLTESVVLSLLAVPLGVLLAQFGTRLIAAAIPPDQVPYYVHWEVDWRTLAYAIAIAAATAILFGIVPALQITRGNLHESLKEGSRGNSASRSLVRSSLVVVQVSLALVSLAGALLFVRTFRNLGESDLGFDTRPLMTMRFYMAGGPYEPADAKLRRVEDVVARVESLPGVRSAFASNFVPLSGGGTGGSAIVEGRATQPGERTNIALIGVTPHFNRTLGIPVISGRDFADAEGWSRSLVAVINTTMANRFWPGGNGVGGRFRLASQDKNAWYTVIGVFADVRLFGINPGETQPLAAAFVPYAFQQTLNTGLTIRVAGDPASITSAVRGELHASDPNLPMFEPQTMDTARRLTFWQYGLYGWIFGTIGIMGLLLASVGVYGVLSYAVSQRMQEIGVRVALGAGRRDVLRLIVGHGLALTGIGVAVGLALAPLATWFGRSLFYKVGPFDPSTFVSVALFLFSVAVLASYVPARRATRVDPVIALRAE